MTNFAIHELQVFINANNITNMDYLVELYRIKSGVCFVRDQWAEAEKVLEFCECSEEVVCE
jgi:hypothetical protein